MKQIDDTFFEIKEMGGGWCKIEIMKISSLAFALRESETENVRALSREAR